MKINQYLVGFAIILGCILPMHSQAYAPTEKNVTKLTEDFTLFSVSYSFNFAKNSLLMPTQAIQTKGTSTEQALVYSLSVSGKKVTPGLKTQAVIISKSDLKDGYYYSPEGKRTHYTLLVLADTSTLSAEEKEKLTLEVQSLPFTMTKDNLSLVFDLPTETLKLYQTPPIKIN